MSSEEQTSIFGGKAAFILGGIMLAGFAVLSFSAALDRRDRATLEKLDQPSAAGDPVVYVLPQLLDSTPAAGEPSVSVLTRDGVPLFNRGEKEQSDGTMMKAGMDDAGKIPLYRRFRRNELREGFFLKLAPGKYMELGLAKVPKQMKDPAPEEAEN